MSVLYFTQSYLVLVINHGYTDILMLSSHVMINVNETVSSNVVV